MITLKKASLEKRKEIYEWLHFSDFSPFLNKLQRYNEKGIPSYDDFKKDYENFFFNDSQPDKGRGYMIILHENDLEEEIGFISYTSFHLKKGVAELDIWLKSLKYTGKGHGTFSINLIINKLAKDRFHTFIMRPSKENKRAVNSYKKAGFNESEREITKYYKEDFLEEYLEGDYGHGNDVFLVKYCE